MLSRIYSATTVGIEARQIEIEVDISNGLPAVIIVGLPDTAIREARDRVKSAIKNSQFEYPSKKITINLAPCDIKKEGSHFDLPMAIGILAASGQIDADNLKDYIFLGELALNGRIRHIRGVLPIAFSLKNLQKKLIIPKENYNEAEIVDGVEIYPIDELSKACDFLNGKIALSPLDCSLKYSPMPSSDNDIDFSEVKGQFYAKRALEIASSGNHNIIMVGPPGSGKTMLAKRLPTILPGLTKEEAIESTKIYSITGLLPSKSSLISKRPFRAPHHTSSYAALVGGGKFPKPGEVSLAHNGILFLDELPEFHRDVLEALRQPLEDNYITVSRANGTIRFPSQFMLICAMNPCPCGFLTDPKKECHCTPQRIQKYLSKISGPLLDRIDIHIEVPPVRYIDLSGETPSENSETIRQRVTLAREIQLHRFKDDNIFSNSRMGHKLVRKYCKLDNASKELLKSAITELGFSARCYDKILKVSRTIADLGGETEIKPDHIAEAIQYRSLDRNMWM